MKYDRGNAAVWLTVVVVLLLIIECYVWGRALLICHGSVVKNWADWPVCVVVSR